MGNFLLNVLVKGTYLKDLLKNQRVHRAQIYIIVFRHSTNTSLVKSGVGWGTLRESFLIS
jgi:hypothetical protein